MQKYPVGIQDFSILRDQGFVYVDKTKYIYQLTNEAGVYFLSRPRRFGKSLLISTMDELFHGNKALFEGTYIYDKWNWDEVNPVVRIDFNKIGIKEKGLKPALQDELSRIYDDYEIDYIEDSLSQQLRHLIESIGERGRKVVILIDEYDKPIIDYLGEDHVMAQQNKEILKSFYSVLKSSGRHIRLLFITGISKFSKVSIFSDLNHLNDITLDRNYGGICGITENELTSYFEAELKVLDSNQIREWYNGYTWDRKTKVYNPFSLLNFFSKKEFQNFWYQSGHPAFLWKILRKVNLYAINSIVTKVTSLESYDLDNIDPKVLLYQTGYITFGEEVEPSYYNMVFPNKEVEDSFNEFLWRNYREKISEEPGPILISLKNALQQRDFPKVNDLLNSIFSSLPYDFMAKENEVVFHAVIHLTFKLLGEFVISEVHTHQGRCDALVITDDTVFCFEFKLGKTAQIALDQIKEKGYLDAFKGTGKRLYGIGVNYNKASKSIDDFKWSLFEVV